MLQGRRCLPRRHAETQGRRERQNAGARAPPAPACAEHSLPPRKSASGISSRFPHSRYDHAPPRPSTRSRSSRTHPFPNPGRSSSASAAIGTTYVHMCSCGRNAVEIGDICRHFATALHDSSEPWYEHVKPWNTPEAWEQQVGPLWTTPSANEVDEVRSRRRRKPYARCLNVVIDTFGDTNTSKSFQCSFFLSFYLDPSLFFCGRPCGFSRRAGA